MLQTTVGFLVSVVESEGSILASIAMEALGHIGLRCPLPTLVRDATSGMFYTLTFVEQGKKK